MISAVVLTRNEESNIKRCLASLAFCSDIIVVDDNSTDKTIEIAKKAGATVFERALKNDFAAQRNFGMSKASGRWILFIDADEEISDELAKKLSTLDEEMDTYFLRRRDFWWGRELKYGETTKVRSNGLLRLVKKDSGTWKGSVHEKFMSNGSSSRLNGFINHYPHPSIRDFLNEINYYSSLRAKELQAAHASISVAQIILFPLGKFILTYFLRLGFLDGAPGFAYSFFMSFHSFLVRAKLYQYLHFHEKN